MAIFHMGDEIELTGNVQTLHGGEFEEFRFLEGAKVGQIGLRPTAAQLAKNKAVSDKSWKDQQDGFRRLRAGR